MDLMEIEITNQLVSNEKITNKLKRCFERKLDPEIIELVAYECGYDVERATMNLLEMAKQISLPVPANFTDDKSGAKGGEHFSAAVATSTEKPTKPPLNGSVAAVTSTYREPMPLPQMKQPKSPAEENIDRIISDARRGIKLMVLMRGLPGSGKSFLAKRIVKESLGSSEPQKYVLSTDDFFYRNPRCRYEYDSRYIAEAHKWNQDRAFNLMSNGVSPIVIDNTNVMSWEMQQYCVCAMGNAYAIEVLEPNTPWAFNYSELGRRNNHNVPTAKIREMLDRYERGITVRHLFRIFKLAYKGKLPPQPRSYPPITGNTKEPDNLGSDEDVVMLPVKNESSLSNWGLSNEALRSWDVVEHIKITPKTEATVCKIEPASSKPQSKDCETMTTLNNPFLLLSTRIVNTNPDSFNSAAVLTMNQSKQGTFEKGTMTDIISEDIDDAVDCLTKVFEHIPVEYLKDVYEKCQCDIQWTLDILLSDNQEIIEGYVPPQLPQKTKKAECPKVDVAESLVEDTKKVRKSVSEKAAEITRFINSKIHINKEHYSDHILKLKKLDVQGDEPQPSTSKSEACMSTTSEVIIVDSDTEFDDLDDETIVLSDDSDTQDTMELKLGDEFISQLEREFGDENFRFGDGFQPVIEVPKALGRQLHALYLESIFKQMDIQKLALEMMVKEDEDFAKKLQAQEFGAVEVEETPNLKQIMSEQLDQSRQQRTMDEWKNLTPDDLAYRLTRKKLIASFTDVDAGTLVEILAAHDNSYQQTVEALLESGVSQSQDVTNIEEAPLTEEVMTELREAHQNTAQSNEISEDKSADALREAAFQYQHKRCELWEKANDYNRRGMYEVARFYSDLARQQTEHCETLHNVAAERFLRDNFNRLQSYNTIDLHHLLVREAIVALDMFVDNTIMLLKEENKENHVYVHIITGRGKNSPGGKPRIRPVVMRRLKQRGLRFELVNHGLLRSKILKTSLMTTSIA